PPLAEYLIVFRLAEQYLIRAEARMHKGDIQGSISDLNIIRSRAGLPSLPVTLTPVQLATAIEQERRVELFCEWGHRWQDLKRTGRAGAVLSTAKAPNWQSTDELYPIPAVEMQNNPFLTQNPGY
ncbi:MAG TPA: RagB/SusD family nutrient uptake outer membrane protein, partial [Flavisolibacter sp.]|nr:RagB/SusD family nutrient uptake outer membrane protein [Flavisolibacter sp.]